MGRIETCGERFVDIVEAMTLLKRSRATVYRMMAEGELARFPVAGTNKTYVTLDSVKRQRKKRFK